jgi:hypothetical protein
MTINEPMEFTPDVSRSPAANEPESVQLAHHWRRCDMAADADDVAQTPEVVLVGRLGGNTVVLDRARRSGAALRLAAIEKFDLTDWRQAVKACFAVGFGPFTDRHRSRFQGSGFSLYDLVFSAASAEEAHRAVRAFELRREFDYPEKRVVEALLEATATDEFSVARRRGAIARVAEVAGLLAAAGEYHYNQGTSPSSSGYSRTGDLWSVNKLLFYGWADFTAIVSPVLSYWAGLANQKGQDVPLPTELRLSREAVTDWARQVLDASHAEESSNSPNARVRDGDLGQVLLSWSGTWTGGRWIEVSLHFLDEKVSGATIRWCTGTGKPSTFLSIESLLSDAECVDFGNIEPEPVEAPVEFFVTDEPVRAETLVQFSHAVSGVSGVNEDMVYGATLVNAKGVPVERVPDTRSLGKEAGWRAEGPLGDFADEALDREGFLFQSPEGDRIMFLPLPGRLTGGKYVGVCSPANGRTCQFMEILANQFRPDWLPVDAKTVESQLAQGLVEASYEARDADFDPSEEFAKKLRKDGKERLGMALALLRATAALKGAPELVTV